MVFSVAISSDITKIVTGSDDMTVKVWNLETEKEIRTLEGHTSGVRSVAISSDITKIVTGSDDMTVKVWNLETGEEIRTLKGHTSGVNSVAISSDQRVCSWASGQQVFYASLLDLADTDIFPAWYLKHLIDHYPDRSILSKEGLTELNEKPTSLYCASSLLEDYAKSSDKSLELETVLRAQISTNTVPFSRLLSNAISSGSSRQVSHVLTKLSFAISNASGVALLPPGSTSSNWRLVGNHNDDDMIGVLCNTADKFPIELKNFLNATPLYPSWSRVNHGFNQRVPFPNDSSTIVEPSASWSPFSFWDKQNLGQDVKARVLSDSVMTSFPNMSSTYVEDGKRTSLLESIVRTQDAEFFSSILIRVIIQHKWDTYGKGLFIWRFIMYFFGLVWMVALTFLLTTPNPTISEQGGARGIASTVVVGLMILWTLRDAYHEVRQFQHAKMQYLKNIWNVLDVTQIALASSVAVTFCLGLEEVQVLLALATYLKWFGILYYLQAFSSTGALVRMIVQIFVDMRWFLVVLSISIGAVTNSFYLMLHHEPDSSGFADAGDALYTMFNMLLLVDYDTDGFVVGPYSILIQFIFVASMVVVPIVLLNLLIALMSDSYERIQDRAEIELQLLRATIILEQENFFSNSDFDNKKWFPPVLQVLVPRGQNKPTSTSSQWQGVLNALKQKVDDKIDSLDSKVDTLSASHTSRRWTQR